ncbi:MAG: BatA domain-containing protein [Gemmatimonadaceae bacterium]
MTFIAPGFLYAAIAVAAAIAALHFLVTRQPRAAMLPTARFVPNLPATATSRAARPSDLLLLLLRMMLVLAAGAALAQPIMAPQRQREARVILADVSSSVGDARQIADSASALYREGDVLIAFDSAARTIAGGSMDSLALPAGTRTRGSLSAALVSAIRAGSNLRDRADSLELVIVSPFAASEWDAATDTVRALWPGRARIVRAGWPRDTLPRRNIALSSRTTGNDPLNATMSLAGADRSSEVRLVRDELNAADAEWATENSRVLVAWPAIARPPAAVTRARSAITVPSISGGVVSDSAVVIATFDRQWGFPADSLASAAVIARWIDGEPAAIERAVGSGCIRSVAIPVTRGGDLVIRTEFIRLVRMLTAPCSANARLIPAAAARLASLAGAGGLAPGKTFRAASGVRSSVAPWLLALALVAALAEIFVRNWGSRRSADGQRPAILQETQS